MKVMLINPPETRPKPYTKEKVRISISVPLGLLYIAGVLEKHKHEVKVLDCMMSDDVSQNENEIRYGTSYRNIFREMNMFNPDIVGVTCLFSNKINDVLDICRLTKTYNKSVNTVIGGPHITACYEELSKNPYVNKCITGEGEYEFLKYIDGWNRKPESLDVYPFPARHLVSMEEYFKKQSAHSDYKNKRFTPMITSRGCPFNCNFCATKLHWGEIRFRSPKNVSEEIGLLVDDYRVKEIHFEDDNMMVNNERAFELMENIKTFNISWLCPSGTHVNSLTPELIEAMADSGCYSVSLAIESGVNRTLDLMNKKVDLKKVPLLVKSIKDNNMKAKGFFMLGYPGETKEDMKRTIEYAHSLELDWTLFFFVAPLPGTRLTKQLDYPIDYRTSFLTPVIRTKDFTPEDIIQIKEEANRLCNFNERNRKRNPEMFKHILELYPKLEV